MDIAFPRRTEVQPPRSSKERTTDSECLSLCGNLQHILGRALTGAVKLQPHICFERLPLSPRPWPEVRVSRPLLHGQGAQIEKRVNSIGTVLFVSNEVTVPVYIPQKGAYQAGPVGCT